MKTLHLMNRMHNLFLEDKRRELALLENKLFDIINDKKKLNDQMIYEQKFLLDNEESLFIYGPYAQSVISKKADYDNQSKSLEPHIDKARQELLLAFQEVRRYEILIENRKKKIDLEKASNDQKEIDELSIEMFRNK